MGQVMGSHAPGTGAELVGLLVMVIIRGVVRVQWGAIVAFVYTIVPVATG